MARRVLDKSDAVVGEELLNRTGGTLSPGDVVSIDTANDESVVLADSANAVRFFYVTLGKLSNGALVGIGNLENGLFACQGAFHTLVVGAVTRGNYLVKSATSKALQDSGITSVGSNPPQGAVAVALGTSGGGPTTIVAQWLGFASAGAGSGSGGVIFGSGGVSDLGFVQADGIANAAARYDHSHRFRVPNSPFGSLPAAGTSGRIARVTDNIRGLFIDDGAAWIHFHSKIIDAKRDFGAKGDGTTDDTTAIQNALNNATSGTVYLPPGNYRITSTLLMGDGTASTDSTYHYPKLIGAGGATGKFSVSYGLGSTRITWGGAGGGTMLRIRGPIMGPEIHNIGFDGAHGAGIGIELDSTIRGYYTGITVINFLSIGINLTTQLGPSNLGHFVERCQFHRITVFPNNPTANVECIRMHAAGLAGTGVFGNSWHDTLVRHNVASQKGLRLGFADHNLFWNFISDDDGAGAIGVVLDNDLADTGGTTPYPQNNTFFFPVLTGGISFTGVPDLNHFILYTTKDTQPDPGIDKGIVLTDLWALMGANVGLKFRETLGNPTNPPANEARLFARDNGTGKTQLCVRFPTGVVQVIATEP